MSGNNNNLDFIDILTMFSVMLQVVGYKNDISQSSNDDLMRELQTQDREYLNKIIENQNEILKILKEISNSPTQADYSTGQAESLSRIDFKEVKIYGM